MKAASIRPDEARMEKLILRADALSDRLERLLSQLEPPKPPERTHLEVVKADEDARSGS